MKKITLLLLLIPTLGISQIKVVDKEKTEKVGRIAALGLLHIELIKSGDYYTFTYKDLKFQHIDEFKSFTFKNENNDIDNLYKIIKNGLKDMPEEDITIALPEGELQLDFTKALGIVNVRFVHSSSAGNVGISTWLSKRKVDKLFGKKKK